LFLFKYEMTARFLNSIALISEFNGFFVAAPEHRPGLARCGSHKTAR
jgi:hypothetical protein